MADAPPPTVNFHDAGRARSSPVRRGHVQLEGLRHPAWWSGGPSAHATAWLTRQALWLQHWRYHPQYDESPQIGVEHWSLAQFVAGEGHARIAQALDAATLQAMLARARRLANAERGAGAAACQGSPWGLRIAALRAKLATILRRPVDRRRTSGRWQADDLSAPMSLALGLALVAWLLVSAAGDLAGPASLWWHARVAGDLVPQQVRITGHELRVDTSDGSWMHKSTPSSSRGVSSRATATLRFTYARHDGASTPGACTLPDSFGSRAQALSFAEARYPVGSGQALLRLPGDDGRFLLAADQAPTAGGMLVRLATTLLLLLFVWLPLALIVAGLLPMLLVWLLGAAWRQVRR